VGVALTIGVAETSGVGVALGTTKGVAEGVFVEVGVVGVSVGVAVSVSVGGVVAVSVGVVEDVGVAVSTDGATEAVGELSLGVAGSVGRGVGVSRSVVVAVGVSVGIAVASAWRGAVACSDWVSGAAVATPTPPVRLGKARDRISKTCKIRTRSRRVERSERDRFRRDSIYSLQT
jgi:hypothetical protein